MSELKAYNVVDTADVNPEVVDSLGCTEWAGYDKDEADNVIAEKDEEIAELKQKLEGAKNETNYWCNNLKVFAQKKDSEIAELKKKLDSMIQKFSKYVVDANNRERRPKRAVNKACANWARYERYTEVTWHGDEHREELLTNVERKFRAKAEYK